jgi:hypothetical protein
MGNKGLWQTPFRIIWDGVGCFRLLDVPVLFPGLKPTKRLNLTSSD